LESPQVELARRTKGCEWFRHGKGLKGHNVTCDNFFTSYALRVELKKKNLTLAEL
ncbi:hypothetical protein T05_10387, partial [Trichinella murrelli]